MQTKPLTTETIDRILTALRTVQELVSIDDVPTEVRQLCLTELVEGCRTLAEQVEREVQS